MDKQELDGWIERLEGELKQLQRDIETAKRFRDMLPRIVSANGQAGHSAAQRSAQPSFHGMEVYGSHTAAIRAAIERCPAHYTVHDVEQALRVMGHDITREQLDQAIWRLKRLDVLKVQKQGIGRRPTVYA